MMKQYCDRCGKELRLGGYSEVQVHATEGRESYVFAVMAKGLILCRKDFKELLQKAIEQIPLPLEE